MRYKRVFTIVIDSFGIGQDDTAYVYDDTGANTLYHIYETYKDMKIPTMYALGLGLLDGIHEKQKMGYALSLSERSKGKDTITGHYEIMGLYIDTPFQTFTETGFPEELITEIEKQTGHKVIGNKACSGTVIIDELGEEEIETGNMIVYTSADSVLQICGNEDTFDLEELYRCCKIVREITLKDEWKVARVIARPYIGKHKGEFKRTANRHDYALKPPKRTVLNVLKDSGYDVIGIGKINDIFDGEGISQVIKSKSSKEGMLQTIDLLEKDFTGLCFTNLVDFDALWGHRRNVEGYKNELESFDVLLSTFIKQMRQEDLLILCADHGNDPTFKGTDHTREHVPCLMYAKDMKEHAILPQEDSFGVIGCTILDNFDIPKEEHMIGVSILDKLK